MDSVPSGFSLDGDDLLGIALLLVSLIVVPLLAILVLAWVELVLIVVVLPFAVAWRLVRGRHWYVEVRRGFRPWWEVDAGSWSASRERIADVAEQIRRGQTPERTLDVPELEHP
ncbi:hypothetical protein [Nocardioides marmotae]|uniref:hypothetical protein n=1 Tax=Nocardioides marmotae TaxID=2663857 RepID=UPI0012B621B6|nr:hypothetical protein [Nocardioides marmotae]MBC9733668.1 hypothetical protein [Nocardioides marmotae]MTB84771.1 hypothetical protein [Nocardioides marmotae]